MKIFKSQITKFTGKRKIIEVPAKVRDQWKQGTKVKIQET